MPKEHLRTASHVTGSAPTGLVSHTAQLGAGAHGVELGRSGPRLRKRRRHSEAPRYEARRSKSENTPAAVTSRPAPGPCTTKGFSL